MLIDRELGPDTVLLAVHGDIDAALTPGLFARIAARLGTYRQVVLDLSGVTFFGTTGYSALLELRAHCSRRGIEWVMVTGPEVRRLLRACEAADCTTPFAPTAANIVSAVATLARGPHRVSLLPVH